MYHFIFWITIAMFVILVAWVFDGNGSLKYMAETKQAYVPIIMAIITLVGTYCNIMLAIECFKK